MGCPTSSTGHAAPAKDGRFHSFCGTCTWRVSTFASTTPQRIWSRDPRAGGTICPGSIRASSRRGHGSTHTRSHPLKTFAGASSSRISCQWRMESRHCRMPGSCAEAAGLLPARNQGQHPPTTICRLHGNQIFSCMFCCWSRRGNASAASTLRKKGGEIFTVHGNLCLRKRMHGTSINFKVAACMENTVCSC